MFRVLSRVPSRCALEAVLAPPLAAANLTSSQPSILSSATVVQLSVGAYPGCNVGRFYSSLTVYNWGNWKGKNTLVTPFDRNTNVLGSRTPSLMVEQIRRKTKKYMGYEGRIIWRRRRAKEMRQRELVVNPSSPVIDYLVPWPKDDMDLLPPDMYKQDIEELGPEAELEAKNDIVQKINQQLQEKSTGRLFAVVQIAAKQFKVTPEDIIIVQEHFLPTVGDIIRLHKIMMVGGKDFTLVGSPLLETDLVRVEATVIEKTLSYTRLSFKMLKRSRFRRTKFSKSPYTMLRINLIEIQNPVETITSEFSSLNLNN